MKNYKLLLCSAILFIGCSNLEENPVGVLAPKSFFNTVGDLQAAVNGSYANMASEKFWGRKLTLSLLLRGDMADIGDRSTSGRRKEVNDFKMNDGNGMITKFWPQSYAIIGAANQAISGAKLVSGNQSVINAVTAQAYFSRAFVYYHLVRLFGEIPYINFAISDASQVNDISKTSVSDVYAGIISDLEFAKQWLPNKQPTRSQPSKATAAAYLASVYLTMKNYQEAYNQAKYVIDNEATFDLALEPDFQILFDADRTAGLKEPLFTIDFINQSVGAGGLGRDLIPPVTGIRGDKTRSYGSGWSVAVPSLKVYQEWSGKDYRKAVSLDTTATFNGKVLSYTVFADHHSRGVNRPHIAKYFRYAGDAGNNGRESGHNYITMRYAEVLLIAAEALNEVNAGTTEADGYINRVRARARKGSNFPEDIQAGLSQNDFRNAVVNERRLELAFEFKRWYDIKRLEIGNQAFGISGFEPHAEFDANRDYLFPLPGDELGRNPNLKPNNPGY